MMSGIRGENTKPEMIVRRRLHALGYRYRTHVPDMPGRPDMVFPRYRAIVQIHGCFWHHHNCKFFKWPSTRPEFWRAKIEANEIRDSRNLYRLKVDGWRVLILWECAIRSKPTDIVDGVISLISSWLESDREFLDISGASEDVPRIGKDCYS